MAKASDPLPELILTLSKGVTIRPYHYSDAEEIARHANNRQIWVNMTDRFPYPYTLEKAQEWINRTQDRKETYRSTLCPPDQSNEASMLPTAYCVLQNDRPIGGVGVMFGSDATQARMAELGYWIAEEVWGQGIATIVATGVTDWAFKTFPWLVRMEGSAYHWNPASMAVLKKAGYEFEGVRKRAFWKDEKFVDLWIFAKFRDGMDWTK